MNNDELIEMHVLGVTQNPVHAGAYALLLQNADATAEQARRMPIVVGTTEAQSIAMRMENVIPPRPITHDLFTSMFHAFGVQLERVVIYDFHDGVFSAMMYLSNERTQVEIDARPSDAIAIALRVGAPIFTTQKVLAETSYEWHKNEQHAGKAHPRKLADLPIERLRERMKHYVEREQYEKAAEIQKIIAEKTKSGENDD